MTPEQLWLASQPKGPYRVLVTGSRAWQDTTVIRNTLALVFHPTATLVSGACPSGADLLAEQCWTRWGGQVERHPADWAARCQPDCLSGHRKRRPDGTSYCPWAGPRRNQHMVNLGAAVCVAFIRGNSLGASHCTKAARAAGILVIERTAPAAGGVGREPTRGVRRTGARLDGV